jgi:predicted RNA binding protein YcfA (HicA-like mRNA interferase family)
MPKGVHGISGRAAVRALERLGFVRLRQKGSHVILRRGARGCVVPMHAELAPGTLRGILRQAGVTREEFEREAE